MLKIPYPEVTHVSGGLDAASDLIKALGYEYLDAGYYARVYTTPDADHVIKIGRVNDDNYLNYVRMVGLRNSNPHLPFITSVDIFDAHPDTPESQPYYLVKMEKLKASPSSKVTRKYWERRLGVDSPSALNYDIDTVNPKTNNMREVWNILKHLYENYMARGDIGGGLLSNNVMWRGDTAVFTDPVV